MGRLITALLLALLPGLAPATPPVDPATVLDESQAALGRQVRDVTLIDQEGQPLRLSSLFGQPLVVSIVYTSCGSVCPPTTQRVIAAVEEARQVFGAGRFSVLTLGFDARHDTPDRLRAFSRVQRIPRADWRVASADEATLRRLLSDLGFSYRAAAGGFEHITQTTLLDASGRVTAQVYGEDFPTPVFLEPLKRMIWGTRLRDFSAAGLVERFRYICTTYNASEGAYRFDYAISFGIVIGGLSLVLSGLVVLRLWLGNRRLDRARREGA